MRFLEADDFRACLCFTFFTSSSFLLNFEYLPKITQLDKLCSTVRLKTVNAECTSGMLIVTTDMRDLVTAKNAGVMKGLSSVVERRELEFDRSKHN